MYFCKIYSHNHIHILGRSSSAFWVDADSSKTWGLTLCSVQCTFVAHPGFKLLTLNFSDGVCSAWYDLNVGLMFCGSGSTELGIIRYAGIEGCVSSCSAVILAATVPARRRRLSHIVQQHHWRTGSKRKQKKDCEYVPCYQKPGACVFCDLAALTLARYGWQWSPVWQSWKHTLWSHNKKMKSKDMTQFMPFPAQVCNLSYKQPQLLNLHTNTLGVLLSKSNGQ